MEENNIMLSENTSFTHSLKEWIDEYSSQKEKGIEGFLAKKLSEKISGISSGEIETISQEIKEEINAYEAGKQEIQQAVDTGVSKEEWLSEKLMEETEGLSPEDQVDVLGSIHSGLMNSLGIEEEQSAEQTEDAPLENNMIAKSIGNLVAGRVMQILGDESEIESEDIPVEKCEFVEEALKNNSDAELKTLASGALVTLHRLGKLPMIPQTVPVKALTNIACFAVDHAKTICQIARKEISLTEGLSRIARDSFSAMYRIMLGKNGKLTMAGIVDAMPILEKPMALVNKISKGITNLLGEEKIQEKIEVVRERIVPVAQSFVREFVQTSISVVQSVASKIKNFLFG
ncbi:MAG: hypothetical protein J1E62_09305 [Lachnospiraceae bacterium]|nr:hypothetical protein [Lachnospiraceae bacterium]